MIKGILFDCGGVLIHPASGEWLMPAGLEKILGTERFEPDPEKLKRALARHLYLMDEGQLITGLGHEYRIRQEFTRRMAEDLGVSLTDGQADAICRYLTYDDSKYAPYPDTARALDRFADEYRIGFLSNALPSMIRALVNHGLTDRLSTFTVSCMIGCQKPDEGIYRQALREIGLPPPECVFVEDLHENLRTAGHLGVRTIRMMRDHYVTHPAPDFAWSGAAARDLGEVYDLVRAHNEGRLEITPCSD